MDSDTSTSGDDMDSDIALFKTAVAAAQVILYNSDSESDTEAPRRWGDSRKGKSPNIKRLIYLLVAPKIENWRP